MQHRQFRPATLGRVIAATVALLWFTAESACPPDSCYYLFQHSFFANKQWMASLSQATLTADDAMCALQPRKISMVGGAQPVNYAVATGVDDTMRVFAAAWQGAPHICATPSIDAQAPFAIDAQLDGESPYCLINNGDYRNDTLLLATVIEPLRVLIYRITPTGAVGRTDTVDLAPANGAQRILGLAGDGDTLFQEDAGVFAYGQGGLVRRIPLEEGAWGDEVVLDIDSQHTVTAFGEQRAGTAQGDVFRLQDSQLLYEGDVGSDTVLFVTRTSLGGVNGLAGVRTDQGWSGFTVDGSQRYIRTNPISHSQGSALELLTDDYRYVLHVYNDTPSSIDSVWPAEAFAALNSTALEFDGGFDTLGLYIADPDGNPAQPSVSVRPQAGGEPTWLSVLAEGDTIRRRSPELGSSQGLVQFSGGETRIVLGSLVRCEIPILYSEPFFTCTTTHWAPDTAVNEDWWNAGDTLTIAAGADTLRIVAMGSTSRRTAVGRSPGAQRLIPQAANRAPIRLNAPRQESAITSVLVCDASGRIVCRITPSGASAAVLPLPKTTSGVFYVHVQYSDGGRWSTSVPMLR